MDSSPAAKVAGEVAALKRIGQRHSPGPQSSAADDIVWLAIRYESGDQRRTYDNIFTYPTAQSGAVEAKYLCANQDAALSEKYCLLYHGRGEWFYVVCLRLLPEQSAMLRRKDPIYTMCVLRGAHVLSRNVYHIEQLPLPEPP